ncbi:MAG: amidohydrolase family protein [Pseudomonadota bacterium]
MKILEQLKQGDFSQLSKWLDSASQDDLKATIEVGSKKWNVLHFLADAATKSGVDSQKKLVDMKGLTLKALEHGANIHMGDIDGVEGDTPFNILAPSTLPTGLEMGSVLTDHWLKQATNVPMLGTKGVSEPTGSHKSTLTQYIGKWSKGPKVEEQLRKVKDMGVDISKLNASGWNGLHAAIAMGNVDAVAALSKLYTKDQLKLKTVEEYVAPYGVAFPAAADAVATAQARIDQRDKDRDTSGVLIGNINKCISIVEARLTAESSFIFAEKAKLADGWAQDVRVEIGANGTVIGIEKNAKYASNKDDKVPVMIPAMPGAHSHLHQFGTVVGFAEKVDPAQPENTFWEWRDQMYGGLKNLTPEQFGAIAKKLYGEYAKAGYSGVGEFHYLLNQTEKEGYKPYPNPNRMAEVAIEAAREIGIGITMLPVLYRHGNFGEQPFTRPEQKRFYSETEDYLKNVKALMDKYKGDPDVNIGIALHSLRAVSEKDMMQVFGKDWVAKGNFPVHIHISEQIKEVEDCKAYSKKTPVDFLYDFLDQNFPKFDKSRLVLIHATQMNQEETQRVAKAGSTVCFCPTTEANLGDGILAHTQDYIKIGGKLAIGPDQNGVINPFQELFLLDAEYRLNLRKRILDSGDGLWERAAVGGARAMGMNTGAIEVGNRADFATMNPAAITNFNSLTSDRILDAAVLNPGRNYPVEDVMLGGRWVVKNGLLQSPDAINWRATSFPVLTSVADAETINSNYEKTLAEIHGTETSAKPVLRETPKKHGFRHS